MKVTLQHKILAGAVVMGLCALVGDRILFAPAAEEAASEYAVGPATVAPAPAAPGAALVQPSAQATDKSSLSVAARLRAAQAHIPVTGESDAFAIPAVWQQVQSAGSEGMAVELFLRRHRLGGILAAGERGHALLDGRIVAVGQCVDGFRLISLSHRTAVFESSQGRAVLEMASPAMPSAAAAP